MSRANLAVSE